MCRLAEVDGPRWRALGRATGRALLAVLDAEDDAGVAWLDAFKARRATGPEHRRSPSLSLSPPLSV